MSAPLNVGQRMVIRDVNDRGKPTYGTITKVGRVLFTVTPEGSQPGGWADRVFRMDSDDTEGVYPENSDWHSSAMTVETHERRQRHADLIRQLREAGLEIRVGHGQDFSLETIEALLEVLLGPPNQEEGK